MNKHLPHVLNVSLSHVHGGGPQVCLNYSKMLRAQGYRVTALLRPDDPVIERHQNAGARVITEERLGQCAPHNVFARHYCKKLLRRIEPDIIIAHDGRSTAFMSAVSGNIPVVDVNHGRGVKPSLKTDATFVLNHTQYNLTNASLAERGHIYLIPNMLKFQAGHTFPTRPDFRQPPVIGALGRLVKDKAYDVLIQAIYLLNIKGVPCRLLIGGEGEERAHLEELIDRYNLREQVTLAGWINDPALFYRDLDIFCVPSRYESFSLVLLEAIQAGLPVVVSNTEGPASIITHVTNGMMVKKEDAPSLALALRTVIEAPEEAKERAKEAYDMIKRQYAMETIGNQLHLAISNIMADKARPERAVVNKLPVDSY